MVNIPPDLMEDGDLEFVTLSEACLYFSEESNEYSISSLGSSYNGLESD